MVRKLSESEYERLYRRYLAAHADVQREIRRRHRTSKDWDRLNRAEVRLRRLEEAVQRAARRRGVYSRDTKKKRVRTERVRLNRGGYDSRGRYWGIGAPLYRVYDDEGTIDTHVRAQDSAEARRKVATENGFRHRRREG